MIKKFFIILVFLFFPSCAFASQAGLVIDYKEKADQVLCVQFNENEITGTELLARAGLSPIKDKYGMVQEISGEKASNSFEDYWSYWLNIGNSWEYSKVGANSYKVKNGDVQGWVRGDGNTKPQVLSFSEICKDLQSETMALNTDSQNQNIQMESNINNSTDNNKIAESIANLESKALENAENQNKQSLFQNQNIKSAEVKGEQTERKASIWFLISLFIIGLVGGVIASFRKNNVEKILKKINN